MRELKPGDRVRVEFEAGISNAAYQRARTKTQVLRDSLVAYQALLKSIQIEGA